jgi:hypothetical protein
MQITITIDRTFDKPNSATFKIGGTGEVNFEWGDATSNTTTLSEEIVSCLYGYSDMKPRTITVTGNVTYFNSYMGGAITNSDVNKNTMLTHLICGYNHLTILDVSNKTALRVVYCDNNLFTADAVECFVLHLAQ